MQEKPRILGLDIGDRRIGVATTDALHLSAQPLITMGRSTQKQELKNIERLLRKYNVSAIVAGNPLHMSGELSPQAQKAQAFAAVLRETFHLPVHLQDERLSSLAANELMDQLGLPRGPERKAKLDQYAAVVILQDWLQGQAHAAAAVVTDPSPQL